MKVLLLGFVWPEPRSSAAGLRSMSLIRSFQEAGWEIHFASSAKESGPSGELREAGVQCRAISPNDPAFDAWMKELQPDFVIFERFMIEEQFGWRVAEHSPRSVQVLDTVDLQFLRRARQEAFVKGAPLDLGSENALREIASIYRSDCTLLISDFEMKLLSDPKGLFRVPVELLREFSFSYDEPPILANDEGREGFMVIGNFRHEPNADGVRWLKKEIWPEIRRRLPRALVRIYGAYPPREMMDMSDPSQGFHVLGPARDQYETLQRHLINLAPLRFGAGLKGKISDGWWSGTPCITTPVGAEGMTLSGSFGGRVAENALEFAQAACELHENSSERRQARDVGLETVRTRFNHAVNSKRLISQLLEIRARLPEYRAANFTGRMLSHHLHRSTKYFSRWIEAKNRHSSSDSSLSSISK
jgi:glycosyltransferase involved in cell wall biosynthesis